MNSYQLLICFWSCSYCFPNYSVSIC